MARRRLRGTLARARRDARIAWEVLLEPRVAPRRTFQLEGRTYPYCLDPRAAPSERTVEVSIAADRIRARSGGAVLEVGNVMTKFLPDPPADYTVVDRYEVAPGVVNADVLDVDGTFDLIVSVSTLEHVGLDEQPREWTKAVAAVRHLRTLLRPKGAMLATWPLGYNRALDDALRARELSESTVAYLLRDRVFANTWSQVGAERAHASVYGWPAPGGNAVAVVEWRGGT